MAGQPLPRPNGRLQVAASHGWSLDGITVRELVRDPADEERTLGATFYTRLIVGTVMLAGLGLAAAVLTGLAVARWQGVTTLGPWGTLAVFAALVGGVSGVSIFAMGATFNYVVSLFYNRPIRQGLFKQPLFSRPIEELFLPAGALMVVLGVVMSGASLVLASRGWPIERLWLYLTGGAMAILVGLQLGFWWLMASVLRELSLRALHGAHGGNVTVVGRRTMEGMP